MPKVRYLLRWTKGENRPVPLYYFYPKGKAEGEGMELAQALRRYPEHKYQWELIRE